MKEHWRPIRDYEDLYDVSNNGRVRSLDRVYTDTLGRVYRHKGRVLKLGRDKDGYVIVTLRFAIKRHVKQARVHRLVAGAFIKNSKNLPDVNHRDFNKRNNTQKNLEWCTNIQNVHHALQGGRRLARNNPNIAKKLTARKVERIRASYARGELQQSIADRFGIANQMVSRIVRNEVWPKTNRAAAG